jgi:hypothetical protein
VGGVVGKLGLLHLPLLKNFQYAPKKPLLGFRLDLTHQGIPAYLNDQGTR